MKKKMLYNFLRSMVGWIIVSFINFVIYIITFPKGYGLFEKFPYVMYIGVFLNLLVSIIGYVICGRLMIKIENKLLSVFSLSLPFIVGSVMICALIICQTLSIFDELYRYILGGAILTNISCGFLINVLLGLPIEALKIVGILVSAIPTIFMFLGIQISIKKK